MEEILASIRRIISDGDESAVPDTDPSAAQTGDVAAPDPEAQELDTADPSATAGMEEASLAVADIVPASAEDDNDNEDIFELTDDMLAEDSEEVTAEAMQAPEPSEAGSAEPPSVDHQHDVEAMQPVEPRQPDVEFEDGDALDTLAIDAGTGEDAETAMPEFEAQGASATVDDKPAEPGGIAQPARANGGEPHGEDLPNEHLLSPATDAKVNAAFSQLASTVLMKDARTLDDIVQEMLRPMLKEWLDDNLPQLVERLVREEIERVSRGR